MPKQVQRRLEHKRMIRPVVATIVVALILVAGFFLWRGSSNEAPAAETVQTAVPSTASDTTSGTSENLDTGQSSMARILSLLEDQTPIDAAIKATVRTSTLEVSRDQAGIGFVDNNTCASCHLDQTEQWRGSQHALAMQPANATTVLGDFNDAEFTDFGITSRFFKRGDAYIVHTQGEDGEYADFTVAYTFGVAPLQQYLLTFPNGRYQAFTVAWDTVRERWFTLHAEEEIAFDDELHWTDRHFTWNSSCAECHSTDLKLNFDLATAGYSTDWAEINVSCQACHGPGEAHVAWAEQENRAEGSTGYAKAEDIGLLVDYRNMAGATQVETCAPCHSRRYPISLDDQQAQPFLDHFVPELLRAEMYHADGQMLEEVYVYGSYIQSKMYQKGVGCMNCHNAHTGKLNQPGNLLCATCHQLTPPTQTFPSLAGKAYDTPEHHFHAEDSPGAQCVNCHMPTQNYMVVDPRRDHSLRIPRPDLSITLGTPNACTQCHTDQAPEWAVTAMNAWYGDEWQRPHYGEVLAKGRIGDSASLEPLSALAGDATQPAIVRATALDLLPRYGDGGREPLQAALTAETPPLMRVVAVQGIDSLNLPTAETFALLAPLLTDPMRAVRIEVANALVGAPDTLFDETQRAAFDAALVEYMAAQVAQADQPEGYANLGTLFARQGHFDQAEVAYQTAIDRDGHFYQAYSNLANLSYQLGHREKAEQLFRQALATSPNEGQLYYGLGLLLAEQARTDEALKNFERAAALLPDEPRVQYNYGLLLQQIGRYSDALSALKRANQLLPNDPDFLYALITFHMKAGEWQAATVYAEYLVQLYPSVPEFQELLASLRDRS